ncbi:hypothetical protein G7Y89_g11578 [Cudoniella acicularis]|uniref:Uncharacterized protein n=1 Tax=Cudoniella acicularis TaxID=354080 RepID=A0A8H4RAK7_9HELO|nr:hypothetical protein G7Y89_g11578 [Cudoniella acicularis]
MAQNLTPDELESLFHWSKFGQQGEPSNRRIQSTEFREISGFLIPVVSTWGVPVPRAEFSKLINGFLPSSMDNKWFVYADGPDARGNAVVYMVRSWTGYKLVELKIKVPVDEDGKFAEEDSKITEITWESSQERYTDQTEEGAKEMAREVCNWVLDVKLG